FVPLRTNAPPSMGLPARANLFATTALFEWPASQRPSIHVLAAIDRKGRARDEIGLVGDQEQHRASDVLGFAEAADRDAGDDLLQHIGWHRTHHLGIDIARRYGVDGDAARRPLLRQCLGEAVDARFGGSIVDLTVLSGLPVD